MLSVSVADVGSFRETVPAKALARSGVAAATAAHLRDSDEGEALALALGEVLGSRNEGVELSRLQLRWAAVQEHPEAT